MQEKKKFRLGCFRDKTYCASPNCKNVCGRKMSPEIKAILEADKYGRTSYAYFCGEPCTHQFEPSSFLVISCKLCGEIMK